MSSPGAARALVAMAVFGRGAFNPTPKIRAPFWKLQETELEGVDGIGEWGLVQESKIVRIS
jgi:hypothetical protein